MSVQEETEIKTVRNEKNWLIILLPILLGSLLVIIFAFVFHNFSLIKEGINTPLVQEKEEAEIIEDKSGAEVIKVKEEDYYYTPLNDISSLEHTSPWLANLDLLIPSDVPTLEEFTQVYKNFRQSFIDGSYENFEKYASSELKWMLDNNIEYSSATKEGIPVAILKEPKGKVHFEGLVSNYVKDPSYFSADQLIPKRLGSFEEYEARDIFILVGFNPKDERLVEINNYQNIYSVCFDINNANLERKNSSGLDCDLRVNFISESGSWKVLREYLIVGPKD